MTIGGHGPAGADPVPFAEAVAHAGQDRDRVVVARAGRPSAALAPIEDVALPEAWQDDQDSRLAGEVIAQREAAGRPPGCSHAELLARDGCSRQSKDPLLT